MTNAATSGPWTHAPNLSADAVGSIHDDAQAKSLGFQGALIGGSVLTAFFEPLALQLFGRDWYERGFFKMSFVSPIYEVDEFRAVAEPAEGHPSDEAFYLLGLEKRDGSRATAGFGGLRKPGADHMPWDRETTPASDSADAAGDPLGTTYPARSLRATPEASAKRRAASSNASEWYTEASPWGSAIVPSFMFLLLDALRDRQETATRVDAPRRSGGPSTAGMNGTFQLAMFRPMFIETLYTQTSKLVERGFSGRTSFRTMENRIEDEAGELVAVTRQKVRWFTQA